MLPLERKYLRLGWHVDTPMHLQGVGVGVLLRHACMDGQEKGGEQWGKRYISL